MQQNEITFYTPVRACYPKWIRTKVMSTDVIRDVLLISRRPTAECHLTFWLMAIDRM